MHAEEGAAVFFLVHDAGQFGEEAGRGVKWKRRPLGRSSIRCAGFEEGDQLVAAGGKLRRREVACGGDVQGGGHVEYILGAEEGTGFLPRMGTDDHGWNELPWGNFICVNLIFICG